MLKIKNIEPPYNTVSNISSILNTNFKDIMNNLQTGEPIDLNDIDIKLNKIRTNIVEYNNTITDWYDEQYYNDVATFHKQMKIINEKNDLYNNYAYISFN